jgi:hypothetical protein
MSAASDVSGAVVRRSQIPPKYAQPCPEHPIELKLMFKEDELWLFRHFD